jgi:hypothetical protein
MYGVLTSISHSYLVLIIYGGLIFGSIVHVDLSTFQYDKGTGLALT